MLRFHRSLLALALCVSAFAQAPKEPILKSHGPLVYPPIARAARVSGRVTVEFSVDASGKTVAIEAIEGPAMLRQSAMEFVKSWKFESGQGGVDAEEKYRATIDYKIVEGAVDPRLNQNPEIESNGFHHFEITTLISDIALSGCPTGADEDVPSETGKDDYVEILRSSCMGACPDYTVKVEADGTISWTGRSSVETIGGRKSKIDASMARSLLEWFRTKDFWSYCGSYSRNITDSSGTEITVRLGGKTRKISDYAESGPSELQDLLMEVDRVSDSHRWRHGDPAREPISRIANDAWLPKPGVTPLMIAAGRNDPERLKALINAGADVSSADSSGWSALMYAAFVYSDVPVQLLLKAGADPNQSSPRGDTPLMVSAAFGSWDDVLVKAGARLNAQNSAGQTALMFLASRGEVDAIDEALRAGTDASLKDKKGRTALDYLELASCGKNPLYDPVEDWMAVGDTKCTAFPADDLRKARRLLNDALRKKN
ncbi:MAG: TonB family protein [Terracidiphilus sp.]